MEDLKKRRITMEQQAWDQDQKIRRERQLLFEAQNKAADLEKEEKHRLEELNANNQEIER
jgi:uncharacterized FlgJ-related protein